MASPSARSPSVSRRSADPSRGARGVCLGRVWGTGTGAPGALPSRPRPAVCRDGPARASPRGPRERPHSLPHYGDDPVVARDGGGANAGGSLVIIESTTRLPVQQIAQYRLALLTLLRSDAPCRRVHHN